MSTYEFNAEKWKKVYEETSFGNKYPSEYLINIFYNNIRDRLPSINSPSLSVPKVLDFGCSLGANSSMLKDAGCEVFGIG